MKINKHRDLTLIDINDSQRLVISCDSSGGIGDKANDVVKTSPEIVGFFGAQVSMMEIISFGAKPISVINTLTVEMDDTGKKIIKGIKEALEPLNFDTENILTGSTEENFPVTVTGIGITVIGIIEKDNFKLPKTKLGDIAVLLGLPKIGNEVLEGKDQIMNIEKTLELKAKEYIHEILPVGSKGILFEVKEMARTNDIDILLEKEINVDMHKSGGPSTSVIVSMKENDFENLKRDMLLPIEKIGKFI